MLTYAGSAVCNRGRRGLKAVVALLVALCSAGCAEPPSPAAEAKLPELLGAHAIKVAYTWIGLSPIAPTHALCELELRADEFTGTAHFRAGMPQLRKEVSESVTVPAAVAAEFLAALARVPVREAEVDPASPAGTPIVKLPPSAALLVTDHYPSTAITVTMAETSVTFSSTSQDPSGRPWVVAVGNRMYVSDSAATGEALEAFRGYLKWERYSQLRTEVMNDWQRTRETHR